MKVAAKKMAAKMAPPAKKAIAKAGPSSAGAAAAAAVTAARETLAESVTSVRDAAVAALVHISPGLVQVTPTGVKPFGLFDRAFSDPLVGVDDGQMPAFFGAVSTAINSSRVDALIQAKLADTGASAIIGDVVKLIQLWVDNPDIKAA
jgi:hypothetical protein